MTTTLADLDYTTFTARRERARASVTRWADRIAAGVYWPSAAELIALVELCEDHFLPVEAARVRRWMMP